MNNFLASEKKSMHRPKNFIKVLVLLLLLFVICIFASLLFGSRSISWSDLMNGLFYSDIESHEANVVRQRLVRTLFSIMCGAALGISGALMQSVTRNPIADPSILGVNTGAALFVVYGIAFFDISTANQYIWIAILGAIITAIFVFGIVSIGGVISPIKLVLAGAATSAILSS